ncbi:MAG: MBL fold metallo-hydrolase [Steroidobacteraceae bacterium]
MNEAIVALALAVAQAAADVSTPASAPPPEEIAPGVHLLRGAMLPGRGPDGNSVAFETPQGLVVIDTGRHAWHSDAILALARTERRRIAAIVNTHWHLDHSSGNGRIKSAHPAARLFTTKAVDRALAEGGLLARNLESARPMLVDPELDEVRKDEVRIFIATMDEREILSPDVAIDRGGEMQIGGRDLDVRVAERAVTDADVWLFDAASGIAVLGDLVTLPAPFFETARPVRWRAALDEVGALHFKKAVPGHGEPMDRAQFDSYHNAFKVFIDCVDGDSAPAECAAGWTDGVASLIGGDERVRRMALEYAEYYVGMLRENGGRSAECLAR